MTMPNVGDLVEVASSKGRRNGKVIGLSGVLVTVRWSTGEETSVVPGPGTLTVTRRGRAAAASKSPARSSAGKSAAKKVPAKKAPAKKAPAGKAPAKKVVAKKAPAKKVVAKKVVAKKGPAKKAVAKKTR
jgi:hypothetical protein